MPSDIALAPGTKIVGKWGRRTYHVIRFLGAGANGQVYLVKRGGQSFALKIAFSTYHLQAEINVLKLIEANRTKRRYFIEADDFHYRGHDHPFYVMVYIQGMRFRHYLKEWGNDWFYIIGQKILNQLVELHEQGWVFSDLNEHNVLVSGYGDVHLIDYGGVTAKGRSVKQYTEINDRGYWRAGTREADEAYDLFAFAILCLQSSGMRLHALAARQPRNTAQLLPVLEAQPMIKQMLPFFTKALAGEFTSSREASQLWRKLSLQHAAKRKLKPLPTGWLKGALLASAATLAGTIYFVFY